MIGNRHSFSRSHDESSHHPHHLHTFTPLRTSNSQNQLRRTPSNAQLPNQQDPLLPTHIHQCHVLEPYVIEEEWYESIRYLLPVTLFVSLLCGTVFYTYMNDWLPHTALYYSIATMLGVLYNTPPNRTPFADGFTLMYYIFGTFCVATLAGIYVGFLVANAPETRKQMLPATDVEEEPPIELAPGVPRSWWDRCVAWTYPMLVYIQWVDNYSFYVTFLLSLGWVFVGAFYWVVWEGWTFSSGVFFSISSLSMAASMPPPCDPRGDDPSNCEVGFGREIFLSIYILVGVPLFTISVGQFTRFVIKQAVRNHEMAIINCPLTEEEYNYAANLCGNDEVISLGEFTMLELLRLGRVSMEDLSDIRDLFNSIDEANTGNIDKEALAKKSLMSGYRYGSFDETSRHATAASATVDDSVLHMLTENDRSNSLPAEITDEMYECIDVDFFEEEGLELDHFTDLPPSSRSRLNSDDRDCSDLGSTSSSFQRLRLRRFSFNEYNEVVVPLSVAIALGTEDTYLDAISEGNSKSYQQHSCA